MLFCKFCPSFLIQIEYKLTSDFQCTCLLPADQKGRVAPTLNDLAVLALQIGEHTEDVDIVTKCMNIIEYIDAIDKSVMSQYFHVS